MAINEQNLYVRCIITLSETCDLDVNINRMEDEPYMHYICLDNLSLTGLI